MPGAHVIEVLDFDIGFADEADARALHMRIGDFAAGRGLAVINEVFDEFAGGDELIQLDRLEVDLGASGPVWEEAATERKLRESLREALRRAVPSGQSARSTAQDGPSGRELAELEIVWRHLHQGVLPWNAAGRSQVEFDRMVVRVAQQAGHRLARRLRESAVLPRLIARMARQWPQAALERIADQLLRESDAPALGGELAAAPTTAQDWEALLAGLLMLDSAAPPPSGPAPEGVRRARAEIFPLTDADWAVLLRSDRGAARARLRDAARDPAVRRRFAASLTPERIKWLVGLWGRPADAAFIAALLADARPWRLGARRTDAEIGAVLREALLHHLLVDAGEDLDVDRCIVGLVADHSEAEGLAPHRIARALARGWPPTDAAGDVRPRLRAALAAGFGAAAASSGPGRTGGRERSARSGHAGEAGVSTPARDDAATAALRWNLDVGQGGVRRERVAEEAWRARLAAEPAGVAAHLRRHGRIAAWRRRLARELTPARLGDILALWFAPDEAAFVAAAVGDVEGWTNAAWPAPPDLAERLREWLLDDVLLFEPGRRAAADEAVRGLVRRRAAHDELPVARVAAALLRAWPTDGAIGVHRPAMERALVPLVAGEMGPAVSEAAPGAVSESILDTRRRLERAIAGLEIAAAEPLLRRALAQDRYWLVATLSDRAAPALWEAMASQLPLRLLFELVQRQLSEGDMRRVLAVGSPLDAPADDQRLYWKTLLATSFTPGGSAVLRGLLRAGDPQRRRERVHALRVMQAYIEGDEAPTTPAASAAGLELRRPSLAAWRELLPERLSAAASRAVAALLVPTEEGLRQLRPLTETERERLLVQVRPVDGRAALEAARTLSAAARAAGLREPAAGWWAFTWRALLRELFEEGRAFELGGFARRWLAAWLPTAPSDFRAGAREGLVLALTTGRAAQAMAQGQAPPAGGASPEVSYDPAAAAGEIISALGAASQGRDDAATRVEHRALAEALREEVPPAGAASHHAPSDLPGEAEPERDATLYVANAGVVLIGPYIPMLFRRLGLAPDHRFVDGAAAERAVHLLQFVVDGAEEAAPEHRLTLNKLLCGLDLVQPVGREFELQDHERETVESLLRTVIARWSIIGRTSIAGLRESFFQREGALTVEPESWRLRVEPRSFDMLIDQIPWGFSTLKLPWMPQVIHVDWR